MYQIFSSRYPRKASPPYYRAARLISDLANPLFVPPFVLVLLGWFMGISVEKLGRITTLSVLFYTVIPLSFTFYLIKNGYLQSLDLPNRQKRNKLFIYSIISNLTGGSLLLFFLSGTYPFLSMIAIVFFCNSVCGYLLNMKWKISIHSAALAMAGTIFLLFFWNSPSFYDQAAGILSLVILLLLLPLMLWSRFYLKLHSPSELLGGIGAGIILTTLEISIMFRLW